MKRVATNRRLTHWLFVVSQVAFWGVSVCGGTYWATTSNSHTILPRLNNRPRLVRPEFDYPFVVSDEQLAEVLEKLHPKFAQLPTKVNFVDHGVRLWGPLATFDDGALSGQQMLNMLLNHGVFAKTWGPTAPPLLQHTDYGIEVTTQQGSATVSHVDHLMGTIAELGLPLESRIVASDGPGTIRDLLQHGLLSFQLNQHEYEWTALATALYATSDADWRTLEGELVDFNRLAERLMRQEQPLGVCYGQHRLYTLAMFLRIDEQMRGESPPRRLLSAESRHEVFVYLREMTRKLYETQSVDGFWDGNWPNPQQAVRDPETDVLSRRILATGHALEWWAMSPEELHPPRETIVRASQWLASTIVGMDAVQIEKNYTFLTHAGRALALWRGCSAAEFEKRIGVVHAPSEENK